MSEIYALAGIAGATLVGAMSPGPSFVVVARTAMGLSRREGIFAALGMGIGGVAFAGLALAGLQAVLAGLPTLYSGLRILGGLYLVYLAIRIWQGSAMPLNMGGADPASSRKTGRGLLQGLLTQISNPKTAIAYASVFAAFLPEAPSLSLGIAILASVFVIETGWYTFVAVSLSADAPRALYLRFKTTIDRLAASVLGALGISLILDAARR